MSGIAQDEITVERVREVLRPFAMFWEVFRDSRLSDEEFARLRERFNSASEAAHVLYCDLETVPF